MSAEILKCGDTTTIRKEEGKSFRILQLTDLHIGAGILSAKKDRLAEDAIKKVVAASKPDFIVITGDMGYPMPWSSGTRDNVKEAKRVGALLNGFNIPWTFVFGNHDAESFAKTDKNGLAEIYKSFDNCLFEKGEEGLTGVGNYCIRLENADGTLNNLLMFIDSNAYLNWNFFSGFDTIHDDQIEWYKREVIKQSKKGTTAPSLAFFHIPPKEFKDAWEKCYRGDNLETKYHHGFVQEKDNYFGYPKTVEGAFFSEMVKFGSCKGMFMGHDHLNTLSLTYKGIRLTYGMSIDYLAYYKIGKKYTQRGGTVIEISDDGSFNVGLLPLADIK